jgi:hypothetical protein
MPRRTEDFRAQANGGRDELLFAMSPFVGMVWAFCLTLAVEYEAFGGGLRRESVWPHRRYLPFHSRA